MNKSAIRGFKNRVPEYRHQRNAGKAKYNALEYPGIQVIQISRLRYIVLLLWIAALAALTGEKFQPHIKAIVNSVPMAQIETTIISLADNVFSLLGIDVSTPSVGSEDATELKIQTAVSSLEKSTNEPGIVIRAPSIAKDHLGEKTSTEVRSILGV